MPHDRRSDLAIDVSYKRPADITQRAGESLQLTKLRFEWNDIFSRRRAMATRRPGTAIRLAASTSTMACCRS